MQLVRGGSDRRLQNASLLDVLPLLAGSKLHVGGRHRGIDRRLPGAAQGGERRAADSRRADVTRCPPRDIDRTRLSVIMGVAGLGRRPPRASTPHAIRWRGNSMRCYPAPRRAARGRATRCGCAASQRGNGRELAGLRRGEYRARNSSAAAFRRAEIAAVAATLEAYRQAASYRRLDEAGRRRLHVILDRLLKAAAQRPSPAERGAAGAARAGGHRHALLVFRAAQGAAGGARSLDRGLRHQRLSVAADRRLSAAAG